MTQTAPLRETSATRVLRVLAALALVATVLGRTLAPALRGAREGLDGLIFVTDFAGSFTACLFAIAGVAALVRQSLVVAQESRLSWGERMTAALLGCLSGALVLPALLEALPERASLALGVATIALCLLAARAALNVARTRALGLALAATGAASLLHLVAAAIHAYASDHPLARAAAAGASLSALAGAFDAMALLTALVWLAAREGARMPWSARLALVGAFVITWGALRGAHDGASLWQVLSYRGLERLQVLPLPALLPKSFSYMTGSFALLLAPAALFRRREMASIAGAFALLLVGRSTPEIPLCALGLTLGSISALLASRDERGMWAILLSGDHS